MDEAARSRKRRQPLHDYVEQQKNGKKCAVCGFNKEPRILQFHHENPDNKKFGISYGIAQMKDIELIKKEIDKCILLCPNCHAIEHLASGS